MSKVLGKYPELRTDGMVVFELLGLTEDPEHPGHLKMPSMKNVPASDRIFDTGTKQYVDIALIEDIRDNGKPKLGAIWFTKSNGGKIAIRGKGFQQQEIYEYLLLSNYRQDNPNRDKSITPIFKLVDKLADAKAERLKRDREFMAMKVAKELKDEMVRIMTLSRGGDKDEDMEILRGRIEDWAARDPEGFMEAEHDPITKRKAVIQDAYNTGIIDFDESESKVTWAKTGGTIVVIPRGTSFMEGMLTFSMRDKQSEATYQELIRLTMGGKKKQLQDA